MTDLVPCQTPGCGRTLPPATAAQTGGLCMTCLREREAHAQQDSVGRRDVDRFAGITDPVELLCILHRPTPAVPSVNLLPPPKPQDELYASLDAAQIDRLLGHALDCLAHDEADQAQDIGACLVCFRDAAIAPLLEALVVRNIFYPALMFRGASAAVRDHLIARLDRDVIHRNRLLHALAWIGDDRVVRLFAQWKRRSPFWSTDLYVAPQDYALEAGWEITREGKRRDLFHHMCHALIPRDDGTDTDVDVAEPAVGACPWCGGNLIYLLRLEERELGVAPLAREKLSVPTCSACTRTTTIFGRTDGLSPWHPANQRPPRLPVVSRAAPPAHVLMMSPERRRPYHASRWDLPTRLSQVGGHPSWIDDAAYPSCPDCQRRMVFIGQIAGPEINQGDGITYAFVCSACHTSATTFQSP